MAEPTTGYLIIQGSRAFCVVHKGLFSYYEGETFNRSNVGKNELGNFFLKNYIVSKPTELNILLSNPNNSVDELILEASSENAYNAWIEVIMSNIQFAGLTEEEKHAIAEKERLAKEKKLDEKRQLVEAEKKRLDEEKRVAEERRRAELTEDERLAEDEKKLAEELRAEEKRIAEEIRLAEQKNRAEEMRLAEEKRVAEEKRLLTAISGVKDILIEGSTSKYISHLSSIEDKDTKDLLLDLIDSFQDSSKIERYLDLIEHKDHKELKDLLSNSKQKFCKHSY